MSDSIITVENLGKKYVLGHQKTERYTALRDVMAEQARNLSRRVLRPSRNGGAESNEAREEFWALKDVSFEVKQGDRVGIIGRNGAGKSTLLKVLSRITEPTTGRIRIKGRVASLLEVGTGFHPELTGRENIYLNGAILGMSKAEIKRKFDEIVDFAEVDKFLDTPVKRYSSGMYVRLAFAVAAHLEPEILIVDEVLAVGDAQFQKKCLGKMQDVAGQGRTVLFVSHNISAVTALCSRAIFLASGRLEQDGEASDVASYYQERHMPLRSDSSDLRDATRKGQVTGAAKFTSLRIKSLDQSGEEIATACTGSDLSIVVEIERVVPVSETNVAVTIYDSSGYRLIDVNTALAGTFVSMTTGQRVIVRFLVQDVLLRPGTYTIELWMGRGGIENIDFIEHALAFNIVEPTRGLKHVETFKGSYQCRFECNIANQELMNMAEEPNIGY